MTDRQVFDSSTGEALVPTNVQDWVPLDGRAVANYVLDFCDAKGRQLTNLSLQKVVYFCHVWVLLDFNKPLVKQEFEAWEFGPVLQYLYREFKEYGDAAISGRAKKLEPSSGARVVVRDEIPKQISGYLEKILDFYTRLSASQLVSMSHVNDGPWDQVWNHEGKINPGMRIPNEAIQRFYSSAKTGLS
jgi:uncharacterized phage-associated protein